MKCRHCAANNIDNTVFCKHCGIAMDHGKSQSDSQVAVQQIPTSNLTEQQTVKRLKLISFFTDWSVKLIINTTDRLSLSAKLRQMRAAGRVQSWLLMGMSFVVLPLLVAALTSFAVPWLMKQFYSNDLQIQEVVNQQAMSSHTALGQQQLQFGWRQPESLTAMFSRYHQGLLFYQDQSEQFYRQYGHFPQHVDELQQYPLNKVEVLREEKVMILDGGVIMLSSNALPQLKIYAVPQLQKNQSIKWQCYSTSALLSNFSTCNLLNQRQPHQLEQQ